MSAKGGQLSAMLQAFQHQRVQQPATWKLSQLTYHCLALSLKSEEPWSTPYSFCSETWLFPGTQANIDAQGSIESGFPNLTAFQYKVFC